MTTIAELITEARKKAGLNQSALARKLSITPQSVQAWESGRSTPRPHLLGRLAEQLKIPLKDLVKAAVSGKSDDEANPYLGQVLETALGLDSGADEECLDIQLIEPWDDDTPLDEDEVYVPFLKEVELSAGSGRTSIETSTKRKLRFGKITLRNQGVQFDKAVAVTVAGESMSPVLPDGSTVGVDTASTIVRDGKMYAINQDGHLRVKVLHRLPDGGVRMRSYNRDEYPDEDYSLEEMEQRNISIIGRVFWSSVLW